MAKMILAMAAVAVALMASMDAKAGPLSISVSAHRMTSIRIEPPRPGGLYGLPRGSFGSRQVEIGADKPVQTGKRRRR